nr:hypothetical protein HmN_000662900 [Hymenolepis microstoma]
MCFSAGEFDLTDNSERAVDKQTPYGNVCSHHMTDLSKFLNANPSTFIIDRNGINYSISIDKLKPAQLDLPDVNSPDNSHPSHSNPSLATSAPTDLKTYLSNTPAPFLKDAVHLSTLAFQS